MGNCTRFICSTDFGSHKRGLTIGVINKPVVNNRRLRMAFAILALLFCVTATKVYAATYINIANTDLSVASNWTTNGLATGGTAASSFTNGGDIFNLNNVAGTQTFTATWTLGNTTSGGGVTLNINANVTMAAGNNGIVINGKNSAPGSMVIASGVTLDMSTGSANTLTMSSHVTITNSGTILTGCTAALPIPAIAYGGTVEYNGTGAQTPTTAAGTSYTTLITNNTAGCTLATPLTFASGSVV